MVGEHSPNCSNLSHFHLAHMRRLSSTRTHSFFIATTRATKERGTQPTVSITTHKTTLELLSNILTREPVLSLLDPGQEKLNTQSSEATMITPEHTLTRLYYPSNNCLRVR